MRSDAQEDNTSAVERSRNGIEATRVYDLDEVAAELGLSIRKTRELIKSGQLARLTYTRATRVLGEDVIAYLRSARSTGGAS